MPSAIGANLAKRKLAARELVPCLGVNQMRTPNIPGQYNHSRMREAYEETARAARAHDKSMGVGGVREDFEFQTWLIQLGMRYLTGGSDVGYISVPAAPT